MSSGILKSPEFQRKRSLTVRFNTPLDIIAAVRQFCNGQDSGSYTRILNSITTGEADNGDLVRWMTELRENINLIGQQCESLVSLILKHGWPNETGGDKTSLVYESFIATLLSAHTYYLRLVLNSLVARFVPEVKQTVGDSVSSFSRPMTTTVSEEDSECFDCAHRVLKAVVEIVPLAPVTLLPLLSERFPYMKRDGYSQACFVHNLLRVTTYLPSFRRTILEVIVDRIMKMDVHASKKEILEAEMDREEQEDLFGSRMDVSDEHDTVLTLDVDEISDRASQKEMAHELANVLDVLMVVMFDYITRFCHSDGRLDWEATKKLYRELLFVFDKLILPTHASCHVQFLLFYICSFRLSLGEGFVDYLWKKVLNPNIPSVLRQSAVCYIGSFLSRAVFVPVTMVTSCFDIMCAWIHRYIDSQDGGSRFCPDVSLHGHFFSTCQAVIYVFAFRHKEIIEMPKGYSYLQGLNFERIVSCCLNPLKFCLPAIVRNFAAVARNYQLAYCYTIIERNNRLMLPEASNRPQAAKLTNNSLDSFFPFDPYVLVRSLESIKDVYREYTDFVEADPVENELENNDDDDDNFLEDIGSNALSVSPTIPEFLLYGTSPGFKYSTSYG